MTVYIDVLICVNMFINFLILICVKKILHISCGDFRIILVSAASSLFSLAVFLPALPFTVNILLKIICAVFSVFAAFGKSRPKIFLTRILAFLSVTFSFGGIFILIYLFFKPTSMLIFNDVVYFDISPVLFVAVTLISYFVLRLIQITIGKREIKNTLYNIQFTILSKEYYCTGQLDTGCSMREPFSGAPVIIVEKGIFEREFHAPENKTRLIPFDSMGGKGIITGFRPESVKLNGRTLNQEIYIGIYDGVFGGEYRALINAEVLE